MTLSRKKLLVLAYEYFPMENANTRIIRIVCGRLAEWYDIDLVTVRQSVDSPAEEKGSIRVIRVPAYSFHPEKCTGPLTPFVLGKMVTEKILGKVTHEETRMVERLYEQGIRKAVSAADYDAIVSFSAPIPAHGCASRLAKETGVPWIAVCLDPYFSHLVFGPEGMEARKKREESILDAASAVLMTYPTDRHYIRAGVSFREKIRGLELPGIVLRDKDPEPAPAAAKDSAVRCSYIGGLIRVYRDPRPTISLFSEAGDGIEMNFIGPIPDAEESDFFPAGCPCRYLGPKGGEALAKEYEDADVLVNIGNSVDNFMPSKIFEYISTGKPIINVYKLPECPTLKYLAEYPLALCVSEEEIRQDLPGCAAKVRAFCLENRGKRVSAEEIGRLYAANTYEAFTATLREAIKTTTGEENSL